jgi:hypothetical protein
MCIREILILPEIVTQLHARQKLSQCNGSGCATMNHTMNFKFEIIAKKACAVVADECFNKGNKTLFDHICLLVGNSTDNKMRVFFIASILCMSMTLICAVVSYFVWDCCKFTIQILKTIFVTLNCKSIIIYTFNAFV